MKIMGAFNTLFRSAAVLAAVAPIARGQDLIPKAPPQPAPVVIRGATVHAMTTDRSGDLDDPIRSGVIIFEEGRLTRVEPETGATIADLPAGARVIDAEGLHVYPGLIAPRTNLGHFEVGAVRATLDYDETGLFTPEVRAASAVNPDSTLLPVTRMSGVLLAGVFPEGGRVPGRAAVVRLDGWTWEDMALDPGSGGNSHHPAGVEGPTRADTAGLVIEWPVMRPMQAWFLFSEDDDREDRAAERVREIEDFFDAAEAYRDASAEDPDAPIDLRLDAVLPHLPGVHGADPLAPTFILADDLEEITAAVGFALERGLRPVIVGGHDAPLCAGLLVEHDIPVIVEGTHRFPKRRDSAYDESFTVPVRLHDAGVRFCIGTTERTGNVRNLPYEAAAAARHGLPAGECVRALTASAAGILEIDHDYGSLVPGKSATLIVTTGNPLEVTTDVLHAFIDGRDIPLTSKQTELRDKYAEKYRQLGIIDE